MYKNSTYDENTLLPAPLGWKESLLILLMKRVPWECLQMALLKEFNRIVRKRYLRERRSYGNR